MAAPDDPAAEMAKRLVVHGRVQGVGFRWWTYEKASARNLGGYVRNRRDGTVEVVAAGPSYFVDQLEQLVGQGPPGAYVSAVDVEELAGPADLPSGFEIRR